MHHSCVCPALIIHWSNLTCDSMVQLTQNPDKMPTNNYGPKVSLSVNLVFKNTLVLVNTGNLKLYINVWVFFFPIARLHKAIFFPKLY